MSIVDRARELRKVIEANAEILTDDYALKSPELFSVWHEGVEHITGQRVRYNGVLYKVLNTHISQSDWAPDVSPSLYAKVLISDESVIPEWEQPESTNTYKKGDKVRHNGKVWISTVDNNSWEPGVYGWDEVNE